MNCPKCFSDIGPNQRFCPNCGCEINIPNMDEMRTVAADAIDQPIEQPAAPQYQATEQPAAPQYQATEQPAVPQYQATEQPAVPQYQTAGQPFSASNSREFSRQYQQYQQNSNLPSTRSGDGSLPPEKKKTTMIVVIAVVAALVISGAVFAAILIFGNKDDDSGKSNSLAASQASLTDSSSLSQIESSGFPGFDSSSSSSQSSSSQIDDSSSEVSQSSPQSVVSGDSNTIKNANGVELASDDAIDTSDSTAESKITSMLDTLGLKEEKNSLSIMKYYAVGNTYVQEEQLLNKSTESQRVSYKALMESQLADGKTKLETLRSYSGADNMIFLYVLLDSDDEIIYQKIIK